MRIQQGGFGFLMILAFGVAQCTCAANKAGGGNGTPNMPQNPTQASFEKGVTIRLTPVFTEAKTVSFGVPLARGVLKNATDASVKIGGKSVKANLTELLPDLDSKGQRVGVRALRVQLDAALIDAQGSDVEVSWTGGSTPATPPEVVAFASEDISIESASLVSTAERTIKQSGGTYSLVETSHSDKTVFVGREPRVLPTYPVGYLAQTGILGSVVTASDVAQRSDLAGVKFLSTAIDGFLRSAMYDEPYAINPDPDSLPNFDAQYEAWLYDRCSTFLLAYTHVGDVKFLRHALRTCSYYSSRIELAGTNRGIFTGKPDPDPKYSHIRGLFAYYAITGDERAVDSIQAIADLWLNDPLFVTPYRQGHLRGIDKLWTERLLGTSLEGLLYGYRLKGDAQYLQAFQEMLATAYKHITGDQAALDEVNPGAGFPPQNCFIHSSEQHGEGDAATPWCSGWMSELALDALLQWYEHSQDKRALEIIVRLARFLRDTGSNYFRGDPLRDSFLQPSTCYVAGQDDPRILVPLYGAGVGKDGKRSLSGEYEDYEHCTDATALVAAARWALEKGVASGPAPAPFKDEKTSFAALHNEFLFCANYTFTFETRAKRNPQNWTSAELAAGASDPPTFIKAQKIGYPQHQLAPLRKIGWWFNMSILQFALLSDAKLALTELKPGQVQPASCP